MIGRNGSVIGLPRFLVRKTGDNDIRGIKILSVSLRRLIH